MAIIPAAPMDLSSCSYNDALPIRMTDDARPATTASFSRGGLGGQGGMFIELLRLLLL